MAVFAVTTAKGPNWEPTRGIREQQAWEQHAAFADGLVDQGVIVLGGPISSDSDDDVALIAVEAIDDQHVRSIFGADPWATSGVLRLKDVRPWTLWLDGRRHGP
ncbi:MAG: YciI family protein [Streptosporangiaceae bacterium]